MAVEIVMPKLGLTMTEGKILRWLKKEGEWVAKGEPLLEILTEKITTEVESPGEGYLAKVFYKEDSVVDVAQVIAILSGEGENISELIEGLDLKPDDALNDVKRTGLSESVSHYPERKAEVLSKKNKVSPLARRIASERGLSSGDLQSITGTGPGGRVVKDDVVAYIEKPKGQPAVESDRIVPQTDIRLAIAKRLTHSWTTTPHFYLEAELDVSELITQRRRINELLSKREISISINDILIKVAASVLARHKNINASYTEEGLVYKGEINIGVAVGLDEGLIVPVLKRANVKGLEQISSESQELISKAKEGRLTMEDITGGTFTISNMGMFAVDAFTAIINPPECAIMSVGKVTDKVVSENGNFVSKATARINVGFDHRAIDGMAGALFLADLKNTIENPIMVFL